MCLSNKMHCSFGCVLYIDVKVNSFAHCLLLFNMKAYYILDELLIAGELQESSKKTVARLISAQVYFFLVPMHLETFPLLLIALYCWYQDSLVEMAKEQRSSISNIIAQATKQRTEIRSHLIYWLTFKCFLYYSCSVIFFVMTGMHLLFRMCF